MTEIAERTEIAAMMRTAAEGAIAFSATTTQNTLRQDSKLVLVERNGSTTTQTHYYETARRAVGSRETSEHLEEDAQVWDIAARLSSSPGFSAWVRTWFGLPPEILARHAAAMLVAKLATRTCREDKYEIDEELWAQELRECLQFAIDGLVIRKTLAPLAGLEVSETVELGDIKIRRLSADERAWLVEREFRSNRGAMTVTSAIEIVETVPFENRGDETRQRVIIDIVNALRLWTAVSVAPFEILHSSRWPIQGSNGPILSESGLRRMHQLTDAPGFSLFWRDTRSAIAHCTGGVGVAMQRFRLMHEQPRTSDRILDQMIIFEALFLNPSEKQELGYRLRMRAAHFLGATLHERVELSRMFKAAYEMRSTIAHGSEPSTADQVLHQRVDIETCRALRMFLTEFARTRDPKIEKKICEEMDGRMLERSDGR